MLTVNEAARISGAPPMFSQKSAAVHESKGVDFRSCTEERAGSERVAKTRAVAVPLNFNFLPLSKSAESIDNAMVEAGLYTSRSKVYAPGHA